MQQRQENAKSEKNYGEGKFETAMQMANKIIQSNPLNYIAYSNRAMFYHGICFNKGKFYDTDKQSIYSDLEESIKICPRFSKGFINMVQIAYDFKDFQRVIKYSEEYVQKFKHHSRTLSLYADALWELGFYEEGLKYSSLAINTKPLYDYSYVVNGKCLSALEQYDEAIDQLNTALKKDSTWSLAYFERGYCYKMKNQIGKTRKDYHKSLELNPSRIEAYLSLGSIEIDQGNIVEGCKLYMKADRIFKEDTDLSINKRLEKALKESLDKYCF